MHAAQLRPIEQWIGHHPKGTAIAVGVVVGVGLAHSLARRAQARRESGVTVHNHGAAAAVVAGLLVLVGGGWLYTRRQATPAAHHHAATSPSHTPTPAVTHTMIVQHVTHVVQQHTTNLQLAGWGTVAIVLLLVGAALAVFFNRKSTSE